MNTITVILFAVVYLFVLVLMFGLSQGSREGNIQGGIP